MDVTSWGRWFTASKHETQCYLGSALPPKIPKFGPHLHRCNSVIVHSYVHPQLMKVLKHFHHIQYGCNKQRGGFTASNMTSICYFGLPIPQISKIWPNRWNSVRVHPFAHPKHMKMLKQFQHIQYGCKIQSQVHYSLQTWDKMLFGLCLTPKISKIWPSPA